MTTLKPTPYPMIAAILGLFGVVFGAFGAHGIEGVQAKAWVETGSTFHLIHVFAILASVAFANWGSTLALKATPFFVAGIILFSGALYGLALGAPRGIAMLAPLGGLSFMIGWAILAIAGWRVWRT
jgi:uncharacterized membrane protein YgdD (TMEM256/DUF423 family)